MNRLFRSQNSTTTGVSFAEQIKTAVWTKGIIVPGNDSAYFRQDIYGSWMSWAEYGNRQSNMGWEIDHIQAVANNGSDDLYNLQPLQWNNNVQKGDS